jgi:hypothetical protein
LPFQLGFVALLVLSNSAFAACDADCEFIKKWRPY